MDPNRPPDDQTLRVQVEEGGTTIRGAATAPSSPSTAYVTDREAIFRSMNPCTIAETHLIRSTGSQSQSFTEEHWTSEIKSFVTCVPPKFIQVIKAYRVLCTDTLTLAVEVISDPPAIFEWFCNDRPVIQDRRKFQTRHGLNITSLTVENPEQGVYKCTARNPAGVSTSYGYVCVNGTPNYDELSESSRLTRSESIKEEPRVSITHNLAPRFINQVPNLTLQPGSEAVLDVEVDANPPARFQWFINGAEYREGEGRVNFFHPTPNRCVVRFPIPVAGEYRVVASNVHGTAMSAGFVEVFNPNPPKAMPPIAPGERISRMMTTSQADQPDQGVITTRLENQFQVNYYQRSSSLPRGVRHLERHVEVGKAAPQRTRQESESDSYEMVPSGLPSERPPKILEPLHSQAYIDGSKMELRCRIDAEPSAMITWSKDGVNVEELKETHNLNSNILPGGVCELVNPEVYERDSGLYKCLAMNPHGTAETAAFIAVEPLADNADIETPEMVELSESMIQQEPTEDIEKIVLPPQFVECLVVEPEEAEKCVHLVCKLISAAPAVVTWKKEHEPLPASDKHEIHSLSDGTQSLTIHNVNETDFAPYTCHAENDFGLADTSAVVNADSLVVRQPSEVPSVVISVHEDKPFQEDTDETTVIKKKEEEFKLLVKVAEFVAADLVAVVFVDAVKEAAKTIAEEEEEEEEEDEFISVRETFSGGAPRFEDKTGEYQVKCGDTIKMASKVYGTPIPFIEWYFGEEKLAVDSETSMSYEKGITSLQLKNVQYNQDGTYYCHATNCHGTAVLSSKLHVVEEGPTRKLDVAASSSTTATITLPTKKETTPEKIQERLPSEEGYTIVEKENEQKLLKELAAEGASIVDEDADAVLVEPTAEEQQTLKQEVAKPEKSLSPSTTVDGEEKKKSPSPSVYDDTVKHLQERLNASRESSPIQSVNDMLTAAFSVRDQLRADEDTNVEIRRPTSVFENVVTVVEPENVELVLKVNAPSGPTMQYINLETILQKPSTSNATADTLLSKPSSKSANAEHRIVILEGLSQTFSDAMTWSLKKVKKAAGLEEGSSTNAFIEILRPGDSSEQIATIEESERYIPELIQLASAANKLKMSNVTVSLVRQGDVAHQELVIEYDSTLADDVDLAVKQLVFPGYQSKDEVRWTKARRATSPPAQPGSPGLQPREGNIVAVFVEVEANCPNQSVEIVASVNMPMGADGKESSSIQSFSSHVDDISKSQSPLITISESSSGTGFDPPKFTRELQDATVKAGESATLKCVVRGVPMPDVRWTVDGDLIEEDRDHSCVCEDGVCILKINEVLPEDEGEYACEAANDAGHNVTRCYLVVLPVRMDTPKLGRKFPAEEEPRLEITRRFIQYQPMKTDVYDEEEEEDDDDLFDKETLAQSNKSLDKVSMASSKSRLVTSNSEFDLSKIANIEEFHHSKFIRYFDTAERQVIVRLLFHEEKVSLTLPATPRKIIPVVDLDKTDEIEEIPLILVSRPLELKHILHVDPLETAVLDDSMTEEKDPEQPVPIPPPRTRKTESSFPDTEPPSPSSPTKKKPPPVMPKSQKSIEEYQKRKKSLTGSLSSFDNLSGSQVSQASIDSEVYEDAQMALDSEANVEEVTISELIMKKESSPFESEDVMIIMKKSLEGEGFASIDIIIKEKTDHITLVASCAKTVTDENVQTSDWNLNVEKAAVSTSTTNLNRNTPVNEGTQETHIKELPKEIIGITTQTSPTIELDEVINAIERSSSDTPSMDQISEVDADLYFQQGGGNFVAFTSIATPVEVSIRESLVQPEPPYTPSIEEERPREPRTPQLPQKLLFKGQEIGISVNEIENEADNEHQEKKCMETTLEMDLPIEVRRTVMLPRRNDEVGLEVQLDCVPQALTVQVNMELERKRSVIPIQSDSSVSPKASRADKQPITFSTQNQLQQQIDKMKEVEKIAEEVEKQLNALNAIPAPLYDSDIEAKEIENAIYQISDYLLLQYPVSPAQAEASEELLRTTLAEMILNPKKTKEDNEAIKEPIRMLKQKLSDIEQSLMEDVEVEEIIDESNKERSVTPGPLKRRVPSQEYLRVTPLTTNIKEQLTTLENIIDEANDLYDKEDAQRDKEISTLKKKELHELFTQINNEINTIKHYCSKKLPKHGTEVVLKVLQKVKMHVTSIVNIITLSKRKRQISSKIPVEVDGAQTKVNYHLSRKDQVLTTNAIVRSKSNVRSEVSSDRESSEVTHSYEYQEYENLFHGSDKTLTRSMTTEHEATPVPPPRKRRTVSADPPPQIRKRLEPRRKNDESLEKQFDKLNEVCMTNVPLTADEEAARYKEVEEAERQEKEAIQAIMRELAAENTYTGDTPEENVEVDVGIGLDSDRESTSKTLDEDEKQGGIIIQRKGIHKFGQKLGQMKHAVGKKLEKARSESKGRMGKVEVKLAKTKEEYKPKIDKKLEKMDERFDKAKEVGKEKFAHGKEKLDKGFEKAKEGASKAKEIGQEKMEKGREVGKEKIAQGKEKLDKGFEKAREGAMKAKEIGQEKMEKGIEKAKEAREDIGARYEKVKEEGGIVVVGKETIEKQIEKAKVEFDKMEQKFEIAKDEGLAKLEDGKIQAKDTEADYKKKMEKIKDAALEQLYKYHSDNRIEGAQSPTKVAETQLMFRAAEQHSAHGTITAPDHAETVKITENVTAQRRESNEAASCTPLSASSVTIALTTNEERESLGISIPLSEVIRTTLHFMEDIDSVQMLCEESDYGTDTETTSALLKGSVHFYNRASPSLLVANKSFRNISECGSIMEESIEENVDLDVHVHQKSESLAEDSKRLRVPQETDTTSMNDIESIKNFSVDDTDIDIENIVEVLPTIIEKSEHPSSGLSNEMEVSQATVKSEDTLNVVVEEHMISQMEGTESDQPYDLTSPTIRETDILSDESVTADIEPQVESTKSSFTYVRPSSEKDGQNSSQILQDIDMILSREGEVHSEEEEMLKRSLAEEQIGAQKRQIPLIGIQQSSSDSLSGKHNLPVVSKQAVFDLHKRPEKKKLLGILATVLRQSISATLTDEKAFDVVVEQQPQELRFTVRVYDEIVDFTSLNVTSDESCSPSRSNLVIPGSQQDLDEFTECSSMDELDNTRKTGVVVSIIARSLHDMVHASLEEIPWGEVSIKLKEPDLMTRSTENSVQFNVTVSESNADEKRSVHSSLSEKTGGSGESNLNIPSYSMKVGSTATITCELNNFLPKDSKIEWYRGKDQIEKIPGKIDRISHDLLEVLVITSVDMEDDGMYSLQVNDDRFPVTFLVVEDGEEEFDEESPEKVKFLTPPQTLFVMDGQPAVIAVQINDSNRDVVWFKERKMLTPNERISFSSSDDGTIRILISEATLVDQGTYYAYIEDQVTSVTLVVEERFDEREVIAVASGTESEEDELREYLVPCGSTATIACEIEREHERDVVWMRDAIPIVFNDQTKIEHVHNGLNHYLVIHDTDPRDSGLYSVSISGTEFKVAHLIVNDLTTSIHGMAKKRISNNSLR